ncbi:linear amide C-N hydrolase [Romboutsia sp.]|uniref:linear amide C-N hydrolase n=1 Tax=Romboutsia sp. TaxID=1965302 RepID=UPI003F36293F
MKYIKKILIILLSLIVISTVAIGFTFRKEIKTINSIEKVDEYGLYTMKYYADYGLDKLIEQGGVSTDNELVKFNIDNILKGLPVNFDIPDFGCTTFQAQTKGGDWLFARNYDLDYVPSMMIVTEPKNGYKSVSVANMSVLGYDKEKKPTNLLNSFMNLANPYLPMDGMNEKGLSIGVLLIEDDITKQETDKLDMTTSSMIRYVLDKSKDVDEAIKLFESVDMHSSSGAAYHFQVADASGDSAIIEYVNNELSVVRKGEKPMVLTNFIVSDKNYGFGKGQDRYEIATKALEKSNSIMSEKEAMDVLKSVSKDDYNEKTDEGSSTQWSVVYNNSNLSFDITVGGNFEKTYTYSPFEK